MECMIQKISILPPRMVIRNSDGEGVLKAKLLQEKYEPKLEFPGGRGVQNKKPSVEGA